MAAEDRPAVLLQYCCRLPEATYESSMVGPLITQRLVEQALQGPRVPCMQVLAVNRPLTIPRLGAKPKHGDTKSQACVTWGGSSPGLHAPNTHKTLPCTAAHSSSCAGQWGCRSCLSMALQQQRQRLCRRKAAACQLLVVCRRAQQASKAHPNADARARACQCRQCYHACILITPNMHAFTYDSKRVPNKRC